MPLILLRHTPTALGDGICYGDQDVPLAPSSEQDIAAAVAALPPFDRVLSSPLSRCLQLAEAAAWTRSLTVSTDERLKEMHFGQWQGKAWDDVPRNELDQWAEDFEHARPHQGESVAQLRQRVHDVIRPLAQQAPEDEQILVVTRAGVIRAALAMAAEGPPDERAHRLAYGAWRCVSAADMARAAGL